MTNQEITTLLDNARATGCDGWDKAVAVLAGDVRKEQHRQTVIMLCLVGVITAVGALATALVTGLI